MHEAMFYSKKISGKVVCELCPHRCVLSDGELGICRGRKNISGKLYSLNYGKTVAINEDPMEKKPLYHFYPGEKILSLAANNCNFDCKYCQNYSISQLESRTFDITPELVLAICREKKIKHVAFTYTEPFVWYEFIYDTSLVLKSENISVVLITNGYVNQKPLEMLLPYISAMNIDLKSASDVFYRKICSGTLAPVKKTILASLKQCHVEITNLLVTGENDSTAEITALVDFLASVDSEIPIHFSRYFPTYEFMSPPTSPKTMMEAYEIARKKLHYVYLGNFESDRNNDTVCPNCSNLLIERRLYSTKIIGLSGNRCANCGTLIRGVFC
ncbi:MAG: AmmeMemoRadiSam system radical SAM enzyme [Candidatus Cloacimonetes bacterium]|nr:AmmeMemoRadiSam system radical SAM enzyme [Candidatus Cloacimonadota bacterium]